MLMDGKLLTAKDVSRIKYLERKIECFPMFYKRCEVKKCGQIYRLSTYSCCPKCNNPRRVRVRKFYK